MKDIAAEFFTMLVFCYRDGLEGVEQVIRNRIVSIKACFFSPSVPSNHSTSSSTRELSVATHSELKEPTWISKNCGLVPFRDVWLKQITSFHGVLFYARWLTECVWKPTLPWFWFLDVEYRRFYFGNIDHCFLVLLISCSERTKEEGTDNSVKPR